MEDKNINENLNRTGRKTETIEETKARLKKIYPHLNITKRNVITDEMREEHRRIIDGVIKRSKNKNK
jgi:hypothetical protein